MLHVRSILRNARAGTVAIRSMRLGHRTTSAYRFFLTRLRKYDPNQPRDGRGRWTSGGADDPEVTGSTKILNDASTGDLEIDSVTDKLIDKIADILDEIGPGSGILYGIKVHLAFADAVRRSGIPGLEAETTWFDGQALLRYGLAGSIRTDAVLRGADDAAPPKAVWDLKTGAATLGRTRVQSIRDHVGGDVFMPIIELNVLRGVLIKATTSSPREPSDGLV